MIDDAPRLLAVAHGTASIEGRATTELLVDAVRAARPSTTVDLCFLDVIAPSLPDALDARPTVLVPVLLSTGYHVQTDIPSAAEPYPRTSVARHLGPDDRLIDVLLDRLGPVDAGTSVVLAGAGSTRSGAAVELAATAAALGGRLGLDVSVVTMGDDLTAVLDRRRPVRVATYLLAQGQFVTAVAAAATLVGGSASDPLGVHEALVELIWARYDEAAARRDGAS